MWRPEEWKNPYTKDPDYISTITDIQGTKNLMHNAYEAGADDMLEAMKQRSTFSGLVSRVKELLDEET